MKNFSLFILGCALARVLNVDAQKFDGESCGGNNECRGGICTNGSCRRALNLQYVDNIDNSNSAQKFIVSPQILSQVTGGCFVEGNRLTLLGNVRTTYSLDVPKRSLDGLQYTFDKFTRLKFNIIDDSSATTGVCLYENNWNTAESVHCLLIGTGRLADVEDKQNANIEKGSIENLGGTRTNWARGKDATQSSTFTSGEASNAVDGDRTAVFNFQNAEENSVTSTDTEINAWWQVDMGQDYLIQEVAIYKRLDGYSGRLLNFDLEITNAAGQTIFQKTFDDTTEGKVLTYRVKDYIGVDYVMGKILKISLNGDIARILSLAEVEVYGNSFSFDSPFGDLFGIPPTNINKIAFVQNAGASIESELSSFQIVTNPTEAIESIAWVQKNDVEDVNVQGSATVTRSENGEYIGLRDPVDSNRMIFYNRGNILSYDDPFEGVAIAIADNGLAICCFEHSTNSIVRVLKVGSVITEKDVKVGTPGFGRGLSITPDAQLMAVGDPVQEKVSIYKLTTDGKIETSNNDLQSFGIFKGSDFGHRVGLSTTGKTLAVAAPTYSDGISDIGAIIVYRQNPNDPSKWDQITEYIYGSQNSLKLGLGGVGVDDFKGQLDANDTAGDRVSFKYVITCQDRYATARFKDDNAFNPICECGEDRKSSNEWGGKSLQTETDTCIPCEDPEGTGDCKQSADGPTATPTSAAPTASPTVDSAAPSFTPTFITASPSEAPSWAPGSLYDGDFCRGGNECKSNSCTAPDLQRPEVTTCTALTFNFESKKSTEEGQEERNTIKADITSRDTPVLGGIIVGTNSLKLFDKVDEIFRIDPTILMGRNTRLELLIRNENNSQDLKICFYQKINSVSEDDQTCEVVSSDQMPVNGAQDTVLFSTAGRTFFGGRTVYATAMRIIQSSGRATVTNILVENDTSGYFCEGECCDLNALPNDNGSECNCKEGFISSTSGGITQERSGYCESCYVTDLNCGFDGSECASDGDCWTQQCDNDKKCRSQNLKIKNGLKGTATEFAILHKTERSPTAEGGVLVDDTSPDAIKIIGSTVSVFKLPSATEFQRDSQIKLGFERIVDASYGTLTGTDFDSTFEVCLSEKDNGDEDRIALLMAGGNGNEKRCKTLTADMPKDSANILTINFGSEVFQSSTVNVEYITFKQTVSSFNELMRTVEINVWAIEFTENPALAPDPMDNDGNCRDTNATPSGGECKCIHGYVSSNGGRILDNYSECVEVLSPQRYGFDECQLDRQCLQGNCVVDPEDNSKSYCETGLTDKISVKDGSNQINLQRYGSTLYQTSFLEGHSGFLVEDDRIRLFGSFDVVFKLATPIEMNRLSLFKFRSSFSNEVGSVKICVYFSEDVIARGCESACRDIEEFRGQNFDRNEINVDSLIAFQATPVFAIGFKHFTPNPEFGLFYTELWDFETVTGTEQEALIDGKCTDKNARMIGKKVPSGVAREYRCMCTDGYFSSRGGNTKVLEGTDTCTECLNVDNCLVPSAGAGEVTDGSCAQELKFNARLNGVLSNPIGMKGHLVGGVWGDSTLLQGSGGGEVQDNMESIAFYGNTARAYALDTEYTVDEFSRLIGEVTTVSLDGFFAICTSDQFDFTAANYTLCYKLKDDETESSSPNYDENRIEVLDYNLALNKEAILSETLADHNSWYAVDGLTEMNEKGIAKSIMTENPFWEVNLEKEYLIKSIHVYFTKNTQDDRFKDYTVEIMNGNGNIVFFASDSGALGTQSTGNQDDFTPITMPEGISIRGSRVRITLLGPRRTMALREVEIYEEEKTTATKIVDLPLGRPLHRMKEKGGFQGNIIMKYIIFIQNAIDIRKAVAHVNNIQFVYGDIEGATTPPTASPPTTSTGAPSPEGGETESPSISPQPTITATTDTN